MAAVKKYKAVRMERWRKALLIAALLLACSGRARAAACSATLEGTYLHTFQGNGYHFGPTVPLPSATAALFVAAGQTVFTAAGQVVWRDSASLGGLPLNRLDPGFQGQYTIDPNTCLGVITSATGSEVARIAVSPDGEEVYFLNSFPGVTITGLFRRVDSGPCSRDSFRGSYRSLLDGALYRGGATVNNNAPSLAFASVGRLVLSVANPTTGAGTFAWTSTDSTAGEIAQRTLRGTYKLNFAQCRALAEVSEECVNGACTSVPAGAATGQFTASPAGDELVYVSTTPNVTVAGRLQQLTSSDSH